MKKTFAEMTESEMQESLASAIGKTINNILPEEIAKETSKLEESITKSLTNVLSNKFMDAESKKEASMKRCATFVSLMSKNLHGKTFDAVGFKSEALESGVYTKAMNEGTADEGGNLVPEEFEAGILRIAETVGLARLLPTQLTTKKEVINFNTESGRVTVAYTDELTQIAESTPTMDRNTVNVKKLAGITATSSELLEDADIDIVSYLMTTFGEALAEKEDFEFLQGDGTNFTGVLVNTDIPTQSLAAGKTSFDDVEADDLLNMTVGIKSSQLAGAGYIMHRTLWGHIQTLKDGQGQYIVTQGNFPLISPANLVATPAGRAVGFIKGFPVWLSDQAPSLADTAVDTNFITFGNFKNGYRMYKRKGMTFAIGSEATVGAVKLFEQDAIAIRVIERHAMGTALPESMINLKTAAT